MGFPFIIVRDLEPEVNEINSYILGKINLLCFEHILERSEYILEVMLTQDPRLTYLGLWRL